jgi:hypothetical protein
VDIYSYLTQCLPSIENDTDFIKLSITKIHVNFFFCRKRVTPVPNPIRISKPPDSIYDLVGHYFPCRCTWSVYKNFQSSGLWRSVVGLAVFDCSREVLPSKKFYRWRHRQIPEKKNLKFWSSLACLHFFCVCIPIGDLGDKLIPFPPTPKDMSMNKVRKSWNKRHS